MSEHRMGDSWVGVDEPPLSVDERWVEALDWHTHFREAPIEEIHLREVEWKQWQSDADNRRIYEELNGVLELGVKAPRRSVADSRERSNYNGFPAIERMGLGSGNVRSDAAVERDGSRRRPRAGLLIGAAATVLAAAGAGLLLFCVVGRDTKSAPGGEIHETAVGERRTDTLADGSVVTLGAQSRIAVRYSRSARAISVDAGDVLFNVAPNAQRPFVVAAGPTSITALGTAFVVQRRADHVVITVTDGTVAVSRDDGSSPREFTGLPGQRADDSMMAPRLRKGEQLSYSARSRQSAVEKADPEAAVGWMQGVFKFDHVPFRDVVQVLSRYSNQTISVDAEAAEKQFTGVVVQEQIPAWLRQLPGAYGLQVVHRGSGICIVTPSAVRSESF